MRCQACHHEWPGNYGDNCPQCGLPAQNPFESGSASGSGSEGGPAASPWQSPRAQAETPAAPGGPGIPWENDQSASSMFETVKKVLLEPEPTFNGADKQIGIGPSMIFGISLGVAGAMIGQLYQLAFGSALGKLAGNDAVAESMTSNLVMLVVMPVLIVILLFVWAGIVHVCLMMVGGANRGFEATFRACAYGTGAVAPMQLVPFVGGMVGGIWGLVVEIIGLRELHGTTSGKAAAAVLVPIFACCCCVMAGAMAAGASAASLFQH